MDADAGQTVVETSERSKKFNVYRINADYFLLNLGLLRSDTNILGNAYINKGGFYYSSAASNLKEVLGGRSTLSDTMEKLSLQFLKYVRILRHMKNSLISQRFNYKLSKDWIAIATNNFQKSNIFNRNTNTFLYTQENL